MIVNGANNPPPPQFKCTGVRFLHKALSTGAINLLKLYSFIYFGSFNIKISNLYLHIPVQICVSIPPK